MLNYVKIYKIDSVMFNGIINLSEYEIPKELKN